MSAESKVHCLLSEARILFERGQYQESLDRCQKAYSIKASPSIWRKIERIRESIVSSEEIHRCSPQSPPSSPVKEVARHLASKARDAFDRGNLNDALRYLKESHECVPSAKIASKIRYLEEAISNGVSTHRCLSEGTSVSTHTNVEDMMDKARAFYQDGDLDSCLRILLKVKEIAPSEKLQRKIDRIREHLKTENIECIDSKNSDVVTVADGFNLPRELYTKLYQYQLDGVRWLWRLHNTGPGGVLADDMGLGKTLQVIAFLSGLFMMNPRRFSVLVVMPVSVLMTWEAELKRWAPSLRVSLFHDGSRPIRLKQLASVQKHGGILLTTYGMMVSGAEDLNTDVNANPQFLRSVPVKSDRHQGGSEFVWDYMILDEAHKIKNPAAKTTKGVLSISAQHRILLTGTAIQNSLRELWALYNCTHSGRLLGRMLTFKTEYEKPITRAREKDASRAEKAHGHLMAQSLRKLIDPYFLRRTKDEVLGHNSACVQSVSPTKDALRTNVVGSMPKKHELVVWLYLRPIQERSYRDFLELDQIKALLLRQNRRSPLMELLILKKLCDHPRLLSVEQCASFNLEKTPPSGDKLHLPPASQLSDESGKLMFLRALMSAFLDESLSNPENPPRTLIFSQSLRFLDMAEKIILAINNQPEHISRSLKHRILRLDGRLTKVDERLQTIRLFERDTSYTVMLLTTQVGGVGLTLTAANRVILLDPSWNPATDAQAVDRAYRIGQKSDVIVYRLITCGTVEEKIYRRQIFKDSVVRQTTNTGRNKLDNDPYRYFTHQDLRELFTLGDARVSKTQQQLATLHPDTDKWSDGTLRPHLVYLTGEMFRDTVFGLSFHDLIFTYVDAIEQPHEASSNEHEFYQNRMRAAEYAIARECADATGVLAHDLANVRVDESRNVRLPAYGGYSVPSQADSKRPMLNRPRLGPGARLPSPPATHFSRPVIISDSEDLVDNQLVASFREISLSQRHTSTDLESGGLVKPGNSDSGDAFGKSPSSSTTSTGHNKSSSSVADVGVVNPSLCESTNSGDALCLKHDFVCDDSKHDNAPLCGFSDSSRIHASPYTGIRDKSFATSIMAQLPGSTPVTTRFPRQPSLVHTPSSKLSKPTPPPTTHEDKHSGSLEAAVPVPRTSPSSEEEEEDGPILMDITAPINDADFGQTVQMKSLHEIFARSGLFQPHSVEQHERSLQSSVLVIEDSDLPDNSNNLVEADTDIVNETAEMIEDSLSE